MYIFISKSLDIITIFKATFAVLTLGLANARRTNALPSTMYFCNFLNFLEFKGTVREIFKISHWDSMVLE